MVPGDEFYVAPVQSSDIQAEQALSNAFLEAGQIKKQVNISQIIQNVLPAGYNSLQCRVSEPSMSYRPRKGLGAHW